MPRLSIKPCNFAADLSDFPYKSAAILVKKPPIITKILSSDTLDFSANGYIALHRRIFEGVFKHAGELRQYDITKKEWVLEGDTVHYLNWEDLRRALDYDIAEVGFKVTNDMFALHSWYFRNALVRANYK